MNLLPPKLVARHLVEVAGALASSTKLLTVGTCSQAIRLS